jgi:hypothetical protein
MASLWLIKEGTVESLWGGRGKNVSQFCFSRMDEFIFGSYLSKAWTESVLLKD